MGAEKILLIEDDDGDAKTFQGIQAYRKNTLGYATVVIDYLLPDLRGSAIVKALVPDGQRLIECPCPQFNSSENAFESELFGHVKGSFTGADFDKAGLLLQAHQNVLFLDEVHTLSRTNQDKFEARKDAEEIRELGQGIKYLKGSFRSKAWT